MTVHENYSNYSFEDFFQDEYFMESIKRPTEESIAFWNEFLEIYPAQANTFMAAQRFIEDLIKPQLSDEEVVEIRESIQERIKSSRKRGKIILASTAVAASIAILMIVRIFSSHPDCQDCQPVYNDIFTFANNHVDDFSNSEDVQLILSEQKTVLLQGRESVITYDSTSIQTNSGNISKNDISSFNQLMVPYGKSSILTLNDGTKIWLNSCTKLVYPVEFENDKREIYVNGEIFLDVTPDAGRPFIVRTNDLQIQVIGTKFNVQAYASDEQSKIALESGLVKICSEATEDVLLSPNKVYEYDKNGHSSVKDADISKYTSWIHGLYIYESERLFVIIKRLERYYGIEISMDSFASELRCTGKLDLKENLEDVLSNISYTAPIKYMKESEKYTISYKPFK